MDNFENGKTGKKPLVLVEYVKQNVDSIMKLFINHVGMMIFALVVLITSALLSSKLGNYATYYVMFGLTLLMYFSLIYTAMWERGAKDKIKVDGGRMKKNIFNGLFFYLIANSIAIITGAFGLLLSLFLTEDASFVNNVYGVFRIIAHYYSSMYLPVTTINGVGAVVSSLIYIGVVLPGAIVSFISYFLGLKGFKCIFPEPKYDKNRKIR